MNKSSEHAIKIKNLEFYYESSGSEKIKALDNINLELKAGKKIAVLGANGSGKTTLFYHLNGLYIPQKGEIEVLDVKVNKKNRRELLKKVGLVFENPDNQLFSSSVYDDIAFALRNYGFEEEEVNKKVSDLLHKVQAKQLSSSSPYNLSWGQKKRVAIASVLAMEPEIMVLDEPFSGLDPGVLKNIVEFLKQLQKEGKTIIIGTHDVDTAYAWADEVVILSGGRIAKHGSVEVLNDQELMKKVSLDSPLLAKVFEETSYLPRSAEEGKHIIKKIMGWTN